MGSPCDFRELIIAALTSALEKSGVAGAPVSLEHPEQEAHGDYSSNVALALAKEVGGSPLELAERVAANLPQLDFVTRVEVAPPGFINFYLAEEALSAEVSTITNQGAKYGSSTVGEGKHILLEHTSPDPFKPLHIGHLSNNVLGMAMSRLFESQGYEVTLDCIINDRGTHVARVLWGYLIFGRKALGLRGEDITSFSVSAEDVARISADAEWRELLAQWVAAPENWLAPDDLGVAKSDYLDLYFYALGDRAEKEVEGVREQVREMLQEWEAEDEKVRKLWRQVIDWGLAGQAVTYERIGSRHDHIWYESALYRGGKKLVEAGLEKGVFRKSEGAIASNLGDYNLPDLAVIKSDGTALYAVFDLKLTQEKQERFPSVRYIWCIGNDQLLYLRQLFTMCEQLGIGKREDYLHLNYGYVTLKGGGRMSSRTGTVVTADELLDSLCGKVREIMDSASSRTGDELPAAERAVVSEQLALGAVKYGLLNHERTKNIQFGLEESVNLEGNSGPYLQYTHARCVSVLAKAAAGAGSAEEPHAAAKLNEEELAVLRWLYRFPEVVEKATEQYAPNLLCNFLFELAQRFNSFYSKHRIITPEEEATSAFRAALTAAVAQVLANGLGLLGIPTPEKV